MKTKILIIGGNGQLGQSFKAIRTDYPEYEFTFTERVLLDLTKSDSIRSYIQNQPADIIINCAAYNAVDKAESEPEIARKVNSDAVKFLSELSCEYKIKLVHISSDYVFSGESYRPYSENNEVQPQNQYGLTKLQGEKALLKSMPINGLIIRTSWIYSEFGHNFVKTIKKLATQQDNLNIVSDQIGSPTYAIDLAKAIMNIVQHPKFKQDNFKTELFHYSNEGVCGWYDFAVTIIESLNLNCKINAIETSDYPTAAKRPYYSVLNKVKIKKHFDIEIPHWKQSLVRCLQNMEKVVK